MKQKRTSQETPSKKPLVGFSVLFFLVTLNLIATIVTGHLVPWWGWGAFAIAGFLLFMTTWGYIHLPR